MGCVAVYVKRAFQVEIVRTMDRRIEEYPVFKIFYKRTRKASVDSSKERVSG